MNHNKIGQRLSKLERCLTPHQSVLVTVEKILSRFSSLQDCEAWAGNHPRQALLEDSIKVVSAFTKKMKNESPNVVVKASIGDLTQRVFLLRLWHECNRYVADTISRELPELDLLSRQMEIISDRSNLRACLSTQDLRRFAQVLRVLRETQFAIETIRTSYFGGHAVLFTDYDEKLREQVDVTETLSKIYNQLVAVRHQALRAVSGGGKRGPSKIDVNCIQRGAQVSSQAVVDALVGRVKSEMNAAIASSQCETKSCPPL